MSARFRTRRWPNSWSGRAESRIRITWWAGAPWSNWSPTGSPQVVNPFIEEMNDSVSSTRPYPDHDVTHLKWRVQPGRVRGTTRYHRASDGLNTEQYRMTNFHVGAGNLGWQSAAHCVTSMNLSPSSYVNAAIAKANPAASVVDLGEFIGELKDLPSMVFPKRLRHIPIGILFGWLPFLQDIFELTKLSESIDRRMELINSLSGSVKKRRFGLGSDHGYRSDQEVVYGAKFKEEWHTTVKAWAVTSDTIAYNKLKPPPKFDRAYVRKLLLSETPLVTAWNLMPWSWLIDYFVDVDGLLRAHGNQIPGYQLLSLCICLEQKTKYQIRHSGYLDRWDGDITLMRGRFERTDFKRRIYPDPTPRPPSVWPILSNRQLGNLAALGLALSANTRAYKR